MLTKLQKLRNLASNMKAAKEYLDSMEEQWNDLAKDCKFHTDGELDCTNPDPSSDPVCEYDNCPLISK